MSDAFERARQYFLDGLAHFQAQALPEAERELLLARSRISGRPGQAGDGSAAG